MNSADQGVFPLDTAFKRRWCYLYKSVDINREKIRNIRIPLGGNISDVNWDLFRKVLNDAMVKAGCIEEDRLIGTWYFNDSDFSQIEELYAAETTKRFEMLNPLCDKFFAYPRNDVFRNNPTAFFNEDYTTMSQIRSAVNSNISLNKIVKGLGLDTSQLSDNKSSADGTQTGDTNGTTAGDDNASASADTDASTDNPSRTETGNSSNEKVPEPQGV